MKRYDFASNKPSVRPFFGQIGRVIVNTTTGSEYTLKKKEDDGWLVTSVGGRWYKFSNADISTKFRLRTSDDLKASIDKKRSIDRPRSKIDIMELLM